MVNNQGDHEKTDVASDRSGSRTGAVELLVRSGHVVKTSALLLLTSRCIDRLRGAIIFPASDKFIV